MLFRIFLGIFSFIFLQSIHAQTIELKGYLGVENSESYTYKLVFTDSMGFIKGFSYTWLYEQKEVKAVIVGYIDRPNKKISFRETEIVANNGFESTTTICLIKADLTYKTVDGKIIFSGAISSSDASNIYCGKGTITFLANETLFEIFLAKKEMLLPEKPFTPAIIANKKPIRIVYDTVSKVSAFSKPIIPNEPETITAGVEKIYEWESDSLIIYIWDGGHMDGDAVTLSFNTATILNRYLLTKTHKRISLALSTSEINIISITADNEGNEPPNTANIILRDGEKEIPIIAYNSIGKKAIIKIRRKASK